ncbi:hypothetical protein AVEN_64629-1 [Araneus ventricosus]|uniref:Uncharacterized protein n=1 Tax=Araneus ventricosus TaxID=182803 RepID=A0A4Y2HDK6_ARAVE|nr:hypothetical protein AVEN_64629-1 [Araneus ventricosus]
MSRPVRKTINSGVLERVKDLFGVLVALRDGLTLSAIGGAVLVITIDFLSACVANLCKCCFFRVSCASSFLEYSLNKASLSVIQFVGLFSPYTHRKIFVTIFSV